MMAHRVLAATADAVTRVEDIPEKLKPYTSTIAVVVILLGLLLAFSGKRALKTYAACTGFFTGAAISYLVLEEVNAGPQGPLPNYEWVQIISAAASGLIGMLLFSCLIRIVIVGLGLLLGLFVSVAIMHIPDVERLLEHVPRPAVVAVVIVACVVLTVLLEDFVVLVVTALIGSFAAICGADLFLHTGLIQEVSRVLTSRGTEPFRATDEMTPLFIALPALFLVAVLVQLGMLHRDRSKRRRERTRGGSPLMSYDEERAMPARMY